MSPKTNASSKNLGAPGLSDLYAPFAPSPARHRRLILENVSAKATHKDLRKTFEEFGPVGPVSIKWPAKGASVTTAVICFKTDSALEKCLASNRRLSCSGYTIRIADHKQHLTECAPQHPISGPCKPYSNHRDSADETRNLGSTELSFPPFEAPGSEFDFTLTPIPSVSSKVPSVILSQLSPTLLSPAFSPAPGDSDLGPAYGTVIRHIRPKNLWNESISTVFGTVEGSADAPVPSAAPLVPFCVLRVERIPVSWDAKVLYESLVLQLGDAIRETLVYCDLDQNMFKQGLVEVSRPVTESLLHTWNAVSFNHAALQFYKSEVKSVSNVRENYGGNFVAYVAPKSERDLWVEPEAEGLSPLFTPLADDGQTPATPADSPVSAHAKQPVLPLRIFRSPFSHTTVVSNLKIVDGGAFIQMLAQKYGKVKRVDVCSSGSSAYIVFDNGDAALRAADGFDGLKIGAYVCHAEMA